MNKFTNILSYLDNVENIKEIYIGLDVSTSETGIAILFNRKPVFLDACDTSNKKIGDGEKMVEGAKAVFTTLGTTNLFAILKEMQEKKHKPWIIVAIENGIIANINTMRKLSLWSGLWAAWFILIFRKYNQEHKMKFVSPREWQERLIPWKEQEQSQSKINNDGTKLIKTKSLEIANKFLTPYRIQITNDNIADALNLARLAFVIKDFSEVQIYKTKMKNYTIKLQKQMVKLEFQRVKLGAALIEKQNKQVMRASLKGLKLEAKEIAKKDFIEFGNKSQKERWQNIINNLLNAKKQLKQIEEDKKIKNKT